jgi:chromosome partitioning protein
MRIIAVTNQKGGSGKTTTAVNLAAALAENGHTCLLIDLDPQASASKWLGASGDGRELFEVLAEGRSLDDVVYETSTEGVDLVPASESMTGLEKALANEVGAETILRSALKKLPDDWDYVLIDCPPSLGLLALSALTASSQVLVPVEATVLAMQGLAALTRTVERVKDRLNPDLELTGIVACRVRPTNLSREVLDRLKEHFGTALYDSTVRQNVRLAEAPSFGEPITTYDPRSLGAADYRAVAHEFLERQAAI